MDSRLNIFLIGKTGFGKSATGNTILNRRAFETSSTVASVTKEVSSSYRKYNQHTLHVIDGPGLEDTELTIVEKEEAQVKDMETALALGAGGIDAFLLIQRFGNRFTREDRSVLEKLRLLFGPNYFQHVIVVLTYGDLFEEAMEVDEGSIVSFQEWCERQKGEFEKLYIECGKRFVLFNNSEKDEKKKDEQVQQLVHLVQDLHMKRGRYTSECLQQAEYKREELIVNLKAPQLKEEMQEKISLLTARIEILAEKPSSKLHIEIEKQIEELKTEINKHERCGVLDGLVQLLELVNQNFHDTANLHHLRNEIEAIRESKSVWRKIGSFLQNVFKKLVPCIRSGN